MENSVREKIFGLLPHGSRMVTNPNLETEFQLGQYLFKLEKYKGNVTIYLRYSTGWKSIGNFSGYTIETHMWDYFWAVFDFDDFDDTEEEPMPIQDGTITKTRPYVFDFKTKDETLIKSQEFTFEYALNRIVSQDRLWNDCFTCNSAESFGNVDLLNIEQLSVSLTLTNFYEFAKGTKWPSIFDNYESPHKNALGVLKSGITAHDNYIITNALSCVLDCICEVKFDHVQTNLDDILEIRYCLPTLMELAAVAAREQIKKKKEILEQEHSRKRLELAEEHEIYESVIKKIRI